MEKLGIIAGTGELPLLLARAAVSQQRQPVIVQITKSAPKRFDGIADETYNVGVGQIQKIIQTFRNADVKEAVLIGKVEKKLLLQPFQMDATIIKLLAKNRKKPAAIISDILAYFEASGISILTQAQFLSHLMPKPGVLTARKPNASQAADIKLGITVARQMANLDIGQTAAVKNQIVLAIEAIEGTDGAIQRGGKLGGKGIVIAKAAAEHHDFRIDVPTVGMQTLETVRDVRGSVLAVEAGRTFVMNAEALIEQANRWKITIVAVE